MKRQILVTVGLLALAACKMPDPPPPCMKPDEAGTVRNVLATDREVRGGWERNTTVTFVMNDGTVRVCRGSETDRALQAGDTLHTDMIRLR